MWASGAAWSRQRHLGGEPAQTIESEGHNRAHEWPRPALSPFSSICRQDLRLYLSTFNCRLLISVGPFSPLFLFSIFQFQRLSGGRVTRRVSPGGLKSQGAETVPVHTHALFRNPFANQARRDGREEDSAAKMSRLYFVD